MDDRRFGLLAVTSVLVLLALNNMGVAGERSAAGLIAAIAGVALVVHLHREASLTRRARQSRRIGRVLAAVIAALVVLPVVTSLLPGEPLVRGSLKEGDHLAVPRAAAGPAGVVVHAPIAGSGDATVAHGQGTHRVTRLRIVMETRTGAGEGAA